MRENRILRVSCLPTEDYPASGLTSLAIAELSDDILAVPFSKEFLISESAKDRVVLDSKLDLRNRAIPKPVRIFGFLYFSFRVAVLVMMRRIPTVHIHWAPLVFTSLFTLTDVKYVITFHGEDARYVASTMLRRFLNRWYSDVFVVGAQWLKVLVKAGITASEIPNFSPLPSRDEIEKYDSGDSLPNRENLICIVCADKAHKNLKIFSSLPDWFLERIRKDIGLVFVGISADAIDCDAVTGNPGVHFLGRCDRRTTLSVMSKSDILLLPSFSEGNPKVVWEAVFTSCTPVISNTLVFEGYEHENYPFTFSPQSSDAMCSAALKALASHNTLKLDEFFSPSDAGMVREIYEASYRER